MEVGDKALALSPRNLDILSSQVVIAQQLKTYPSAFKYALLGGNYYNSIEKQPKPAGTADDAFQTNVKFDLDSNKNNYQFFQSAAFAVIQNENNSKARMDEIEKFTAAFPKSGLDEQLTSYALMSLSELNDTPRLIAYANKVLETKPENLDALLMLANSYLDGGNATKAVTYGQKLVLAAKADDPSASKANKTFAGMGHTVTGRAYASQQKMQQSIAELKSAVDLLKGEDEQQYAVAAYFLGWDYARENKFADARAVLTQIVAIPGPVQAPAKDLLGKVNSARAAGN
jgi:tetratricopeptide (TPR) repeat protein